MKLVKADIDAVGRPVNPMGAGGGKVMSRDRFLKRIPALVTEGITPAALRAISAYAGASHYLLVRGDLLQEQALDFVVSSNWPFDLVRRLAADLASAQVRTTELEKCLSLLVPVFSMAPDDAEVPEGVSRQYCSLTFCVGRLRYSLLLLFSTDADVTQDRLREAALFSAYAASFSVESEARPEREVELTERELECLFWIAEGKTSDEIATILGISRNTINNYITSVMRKTATRTRSEAIAYAVRNNLV